MKNIPFAKLTGAGNDFVIIDNRSAIIRAPNRLAMRLCDRRFGIGADGLILIEESRVADYRMMYYNSDGSYGGMCGNGGRCAARFASDQGIAQDKHRFEALDFSYEATVTKRSVTLRMKNVIAPQFSKSLQLGDEEFNYHFMDTGSPHAVIAVNKSQLNAVPVESLGKSLRHHKAFSPKGTNVNFLAKKSSRAIRMRTYERGVEAETLACGTGSIACSIVASVLWNMKPPVTVITQSCEVLIVNFKETDRGFEAVTLTGPAEKVFKGEVRG
jgi:diaminopimelate epimerase